MDPKVVGACRIGEQMEALGEFHWVDVVVDDEVAAHRNQDAVRLHGRGRLAITRDDFVLDALEGELLADGGKRGKAFVRRRR